MSFERPKQSQENLVTEFPELNLSTGDQHNPIAVNAVLGKAAELLASWGRNSGEISEIHLMMQKLQTGEVHPGNAYRWLVGVVNQKQDYN